MNENILQSRMKYKKKLLWIVLISIVFQSCTKCANPPFSDKWLDLKSVQNARQLGGYPTKNNRVVKQNAILRTGELAFLSNDDKNLLVNEYRLAHIIDLRDEDEVTDSPDPVIEGVQYHNLIVWTREVRIRNFQESITDWGFDNDLYIKNYYTAFALEPAAIEAYKTMFDVLLKNETGSVLIHCMYGKDRSGVAAALILSALDVEWSIIEQEYLLSNTAFPGSVNISSLRHYKSVIETNYGSIEKYLETEMNLDENDLIVLREKYTID
jgi:protein-tyrosine phosphatase